MIPNASARDVAGILGNRLPQSDWLEGRSLSIVLAEGSLSMSFTDFAVHWRLPDGTEGIDTYDAVEVRPNMYFLDVWLRSSDDHRSLTVVVDVRGGNALTVLSTASKQGYTGETNFAQAFAPGCLPDRTGPWEQAAQPSRDPIGQRLLSYYSPDLVFEHIYLNSDSVAWQCLRGWEPGANDTNEATYWRFADDLYVFGFRESAAQSSSVFLLDLKEQRSTGQFHGVGETGQLVHGALGAALDTLGSVRYPADLHPI
ncbi:MoaF C-terminal domain-containing protein [Paenarthrobacter nitroguajacolicus]|uniref:MoaF C-terminal domain-containing protein n=1 Tax=Paenarthrobacter nitroguajacolicus TaxID=211146 RepID=UPI00343AACED